MFEIGKSSQNHNRMRESKNSDTATVQAKCKKSKQQFLNMRCNPERFCELVSVLNDKQKWWIKQMGFDHLIKLSLRKVDRHLGLWLMKRFDPEHKSLLVRDNYSIVVNPNDVGWVMGIPGPGRSVPKDISLEHLRFLKLKYGNDKGIDERVTFDAMVNGNLSETEFKQSFLLYALGVLLCPTQSSKISPVHLKVLHNAQNATIYDWSKYVFDWLVTCAIRFKHSKSRGYGGCAIFLMIFYLDRINVGFPVNWSVTSSRIDAWSHEMYRDAIQKDKKNAEEFGNAELVPNVTYGLHYPIQCPHYSHMWAGTVLRRPSRMLRLKQNSW